MNKNLLYTLAFCGFSSFCAYAADLDSAPNTPPSTPPKAQTSGLTPQTPPTPPTLLVVREDKNSPIIVFNNNQMSQGGSAQPLSPSELQDVLSQFKSYNSFRERALTKAGVPVNPLRRSLMTDFNDQNLEDTMTESMTEALKALANLKIDRPALPPTWPVVK